MVATHIAEVEGKKTVFFANFKGLRGGENPIQTPETGAKVVIPGHVRGHFLLFLGEEHAITGEFRDGATEFMLPEITRGAAVWFEEIS